MLDCVKAMEYETECTKRSQVQLKLKGSIIGLKYSLKFDGRDAAYWKQKKLFLVPMGELDPQD